MLENIQVPVVSGRSTFFAFREADILKTGTKANVFQSGHGQIRALDE